jgi:hypothetical protein
VGVAVVPAPLAQKAVGAAVVVLAEQVLVVHQYLVARVATLLALVFSPVVVVVAAHQQIQTPPMVVQVE